MIKLSRINRAEALRYMGGAKTALTPEMTGLMDECERELLECAKPAYLFRIVSLDTEGLIEGNDIKNHLEGCQSAVVMCATLGIGVDRLIRISQIKDMARAVVLDSMASAAIEQVCAKADELIAGENKGMNMTFRFSPGYGDYPLDRQRLILTLLDAPRKIGLSINESFLLIPAKSVTAVAGLSANPIEQKKRGCAVCNLRGTCRYRKSGEHCGF